MTSAKVLIENNEAPMVDMFCLDWGMEQVFEAKDADLIVFGGGTDVNPMLYNETPDPRTQHPDVPRDCYCTYLYNYARANNTPIVGICRGAQFITVMQGGSLIQHIEDHNEYIHTVKFDPKYQVNGDPDEMTVTSDHHQVMLPSPQLVQVESLAVLASSSEGYAEITCLMDGESRVTELCIQGHPEWADPGNEFREWTKNFINNYLLED